MQGFYEYIEQLAIHSIHLKELVEYSKDKSSGVYHKSTDGRIDGSIPSKQEIKDAEKRSKKILKPIPKSPNIKPKTKVKAKKSSSKPTF